ncbi:MAG: Glutamyl-tRNA(Gln) amidotransferase subunit A [Candidatus Yanofskybacteria bacterium GW2011_GWD1_39_16]|uniref:Glutamyl-tRNA(Gln) amidotransferase subunit A n=1 Tax=Candidatus Yanofskybacteria bacterium GW2011_GWD1_39_16 TaxID=1619030 RepID=A0A837HQ38_9BACT|nr:MAG: Glutamyl-tRNA(Gln) amidotransferase subunit A [Candidatus Yanofskybacteria bacterium GW2011_GWD1_39_16]
MESHNYTIRTTLEGLKAREFSAEEIFNYYTEKILKENPRLNAYLNVLPFKNNNQRGILAGIPAAIKDNVLIQGFKCTAGSKILENYIASYDATSIQKLREEGVTFIGKTNLDEFAMGSSTESSAYGPTRNPADLSCVPGGSSGGSAAAVAADLAVFALGSDTAGSIRQPAGFCGVVGLKPTYGRVSRYGLIAMTSSLDQIGPITKNIYDSALLLNILSGHDKYDSTTVVKNIPDFTKNLGKDLDNIKIGVPKEFFREGLDSEVKESVEEGIAILERLGCEIKEITLPHSEYSIAAYYIIAPSEISSNLARFDGIRYGLSDKTATSLIDTYINSRECGFGPEVKRRIMLGTFALSSGYYDAYYLKAQKIRTLIKKDFNEAFKEVDAIVGPTSPSVAFKLGEKSSDPLSMYLSDIYTVPVNLAGLPGLSMPVTPGKKSHLPIGFHIIGKPFDEGTILQIAHQLEQEIKNG